MSKPNCKECRYSEVKPHHYKEDGFHREIKRRYCLKNPPAIDGWPTVMDKDWCGHFIQKAKDSQ